jgi:hypothetical protein
MQNNNAPASTDSKPIEDAFRPASKTRRGIAVSIALGVTLLSLLLLLAHSHALPMTWDEGNAIQRSDQIREWTTAVLVPERSQLKADPWSEDGICDGWPFTTQIEGHPPFYAIVIATGRWLSESWLSPLQSARFGPILLFALTIGVVCYRLQIDYGRLAALTAVAAIFCLPRLLVHAQTASFDGPLTACWLLCWAAFIPASRSWRWIPLWGLTLGLVLSCKVTGWFAPLPFVVWVMLYPRRSHFLALAVGLPIAILAFFALNPPLWVDPVAGFQEFYHLNVTREKFNIPTQFLGEMYNRDNPLPAWNTLFWTLITVPLGLLILLPFGLVRVVREWKIQPLGLLLLGHWLILIVVRALPIAPPHDGVRLFVTSFAFLAILLGIGFDTAQRTALARRNPMIRIVSVACPTLLLISAASSVLWYAPHGLSYYNLLIGGQTGAARAGMEPTYYWDGLDEDAIDWLNTNTPEDRVIVIGSPSYDNIRLQREWEEIERYTIPLSDAIRQWDHAPQFHWYVVQHRPSGWNAVDRRLIEAYEPEYETKLPHTGPGTWRCDAPLIGIYEFSDFLQAYQDVAVAAEGEKN